MTTLTIKKIIATIAIPVTKAQISIQSRDLNLNISVDPDLLEILKDPAKTISPDSLSRSVSPSPLFSPSPVGSSFSRQGASSRSPFPSPSLVTGNLSSSELDAQVLGSFRFLQSGSSPAPAPTPGPAPYPIIFSIPSGGRRSQDQPDFPGSPKRQIPEKGFPSSSKDRTTLSPELSVLKNVREEEVTMGNPVRSNDWEESSFRCYPVLLENIATVLNSMGIRFYIHGGSALWLTGTPRPGDKKIKDLDIVIENPAPTRNGVEFLDLITEKLKSSPLFTDLDIWQKSHSTSFSCTRTFNTKGTQSTKVSFSLHVENKDFFDTIFLPQSKMLTEQNFGPHPVFFHAPKGVHQILTKEGGTIDTRLYRADKQRDVLFDCVISLAYRPDQKEAIFAALSRADELNTTKTVETYKVETELKSNLTLKFDSKTGKQKRLCYFIHLYNLLTDCRRIFGQDNLLHKHYPEHSAKLAASFPILFEFIIREIKDCLKSTDDALVPPKSEEKSQILPPKPECLVKFPPLI